MFSFASPHHQQPSWNPKWLMEEGGSGHQKGKKVVLNHIYPRRDQECVRLIWELKKNKKQFEIEIVRRPPPAALGSYLTSHCPPNVTCSSRVSLSSCYSMFRSKSMRRNFKYHSFKRLRKCTNIQQNPQPLSNTHCAHVWLSWVDFAVRHF